MCAPRTFWPFRRTVRDTSVCLKQKLYKSQNLYYGLSEGEKSIVQDQARTIRPLESIETRSC
jgi:hypothetical protein